MYSGLALALLPLSRPKLLWPRQSRPKLLRPWKNKCRVVWPSHHRDAQNYYDLKKINVEWSGPLTFVSSKIIMTSSITRILSSGSIQVHWGTHSRGRSRPFSCRIKDINSYAMKENSSRCLILSKTFIKNQLLLAILQINAQCTFDRWPLNWLIH